MPQKAQAAVRSWRCRHGVSLRELSALTGIPQSELSRFERCLRPLPALRLIRIAQVTGTPIEELASEICQDRDIDG